MARDITKLHPDLQKKVTLLKDECKKQGLIIGIGECVRTVAEQDALYAKGRTVAGSIVTNAKGSSYSSMHQWGVAFDFYRNDGKGAYENKDNFFQKVGAIGKKLGLEWGGNWTSIKDYPHFQLPNWGSTTSKLKSQYGTPDKFFKTWTKATTTSTASKTTTTTKTTTTKKAYSGTIPTKTLKKGAKGTDVTNLQKFLKWYGCSVTTDGNFGAATETAVKKFQKLEGLTGDGIWGSKSAAKAKTIKK